MAYNVLDYGKIPLCQGPNYVYHGYLKTIVEFANPDVVGLTKMGSVKSSSTDFSYSAQAGFQDSILLYALNAAYPGRYNYCPNTNLSKSSNECLLFYNQQKLGFVSITCVYVNTEDFDTYKLYYKDPNLATNHDTTFLYITLNHDISGSGSAADRGAQMAGEMTQIRGHFSHLANMVSMGDFNVRSSTEAAYQAITNSSDTNFRFYDPPFYPDVTFTYPGNWEANTTAYASYLTTSTRSSGTVPNACGTNGGAKDWYDHIFLSPWIVNNQNYISYISHSFRVIGNDGHRVGISVNSAPTNTSAPSTVTDALFQMSNKYPVMVDLLLTPNTTGSSPSDPELVQTAITDQHLENGRVTLVNPVGSEIVLDCSTSLIGRKILLECVDMLGRALISRRVLVENETVSIPCSFSPGAYYVRVTDNGYVLCKTILLKK